MAFRRSVGCDLEFGVFNRLAAAISDRNVEMGQIARPIGETSRRRGDHHVRVDGVKDVVELARISPHVEKPIGFPVAIGQLGNDVTGERGMPAHRLNLVFQRPELLPLRFLDEAVQGAEHAVKAPIEKPILDSMRVHNALAPIVTGLEPPWFISVLVAQILRVGEAPIAELRDHQGLVAGDDRIALGAEQPVRPLRKGSDERVPFVTTIGKRRIEMIVSDVGLDVEA